jgi:cation transport ATPase
MEPQVGHETLSQRVEGNAMRDPVCGMPVTNEASHRAVHGGREVLFCSAACKAKYEADPAKYVRSSESSSAGDAVSNHDHRHASTSPVTGPALAPPGAKWTCPMHPQIVRDGPGSCPICGMALEPMVPVTGSAPNAELADMTRRFWVGLALAVPVFALEMGGHVTNLHQWLDQQTSNWIQLVLASPVVLWAGWPFFERAWVSLRNRSLNMFTLIAMGTGVAWAYSVAGTLAPQAFPEAFRMSG